MSTPSNAVPAFSAGSQGIAARRVVRDPAPVLVNPS